MKKDTYKTDVMFRVDITKDFKNTVFAILPHQVDDHKGHVTTYQHVGQHSAGDYNHCIRTSRPANAIEFIELHKELLYLGYNLNIVRRQNRDKYLKNYMLIKEEIYL